MAEKKSAVFLGNGGENKLNSFSPPLFQKQQKKDFNSFFQKKAEYIYISPQFFQKQQIFLLVTTYH